MPTDVEVLVFAAPSAVDGFLDFEGTKYIQPFSCILLPFGLNQVSPVIFGKPALW